MPIVVDFVRELWDGRKLGNIECSEIGHASEACHEFIRVDRGSPHFEVFDGSTGACHEGIETIEVEAWSFCLDHKS